MRLFLFDVMFMCEILISGSMPSLLKAPLPVRSPAAFTVLTVELGLCTAHLRGTGAGDLPLAGPGGRRSHGGGAPEPHRRRAHRVRRAWRVARAARRAVSPPCAVAPWCFTSGTPPGEAMRKVEQFRHGVYYQIGKFLTMFPCNVIAFPGKQTIQNRETGKNIGVFLFCYVCVFFLGGDGGSSIGRWKFGSCFGVFERSSQVVHGFCTL